MSHANWNASALIANDAQLAKDHAEVSKWLQPASDASIARTVDALKAKHGATVVVVNKADALKGTCTRRL